MSRPRKPFGAQQPGRLHATMMKVLAAEMSDPQRLRRGKQYAKDGSVTDIIVQPGTVTCEVQGSRATPYIASLHVTSGDGMPLRRDVTARCTCPDDANTASHACKHVLATMFVFSDELLIEPQLLDVWRDNDHIPDASPGDDDRGQSGDEDVDGHRDEDDDFDGTSVGSTPKTLRSVRSFDPDADDEAETNSLRRGRRTGDRRAESTFSDRDTDADDDPTDVSIGRRRRHLELVREGMEQGRAERRERQARRVREPHVDPIAHVLAFPADTELPEVGIIEDSTDIVPKRPELASVLRDAYSNLRLDWD